MKLSEKIENIVYSARLSVREFVEFICRSGDIDKRRGIADPTAMREGQKLHKRIQDAQPEQYEAEVNLEHEDIVEYRGEQFAVFLTGRADGIISIDNPIEKFAFENTQLSLLESDFFIDEIKTMYADVTQFTEPVPVHLAQAKCYALFFAKRGGLNKIGVQMTYCSIDSEKFNYFTFEYTLQELKEWFEGLLLSYAKWLHWEYHHILERNATIRAVDFPFEYRPGQKELVKNVYLSFLHGKKIFIEAPTGVGKTISTVFPAVKGLAEGLGRKLFYTTARTITRTVAEETAGILKTAGMDILAITLTAKDKICIFEKSDCNPEKCPRAKGHEDRVNDAVFDLITHEKSIDRGIIETYATLHNVCPFEMALDVSLWCDMIICDYNYCFDPDVNLKRFFGEGRQGEYLLLVDEAHNLVERAREMYSASISTFELKDARPRMKDREENRRLFTKIAGRITKLSNEVFDIERKTGAHGKDDRPSLFGSENAGEKASLTGVSEGYGLRAGTGSAGYEMRGDSGKTGSWNKKRVSLSEVDFEDCETIFLELGKLFEKMKRYVSDRKKEQSDELLEFFFNLRYFIMTLERHSDDYTVTLERNAKETTLSLRCMNPGRRLSEYLSFHRGAAFFSATLLPVKYYMEQLSGTEEDYAVYAPSPFNPDRRCILVANDVSAKYTRRSRDEYEKFMRYIDVFIHSHVGNYLVFFPSYKVMDEIYNLMLAEFGGFPENFDFTLVKQRTDMSEPEREEFLENFSENPDKTTVGFCVMGGIFSEGIDLRADRLIGVAVIGTGLPQVCEERELLKTFYDASSGKGFEHAYLWPGMNKVLQAGGRVIRTESDRGVILLLDERFLQRSVNCLFPREWEGYVQTDLSGLGEKLENFWNKEE